MAGAQNQQQNSTKTTKKKSAEKQVTPSKKGTATQKRPSEKSLNSSPAPTGCGFWWFLLVVLRLALVLAPQTGYIQPDEFIQSVEITAGDVFHVETIRPWEYTVGSPIRSAIFPFLSSGWVFLAIRDGAEYVQTQFKFNIITPYILLVAPRLVMFLISLIGDWCMYSIISKIRFEKVSPQKVLAVYASSYVVLTYATRTFSNSLELILFALLLRLVVGALSHADKHKEAKKGGKKVMSGRGDAGDYEYSQSSPVVLPNGCMIGVILVLGVFNRPTFMAYAIIPLLFWLLNGISVFSMGIFKIIPRTLLLAPSVAITALCAILADSVYYGRLHVEDLHGLAMRAYEQALNVEDPLKEILPKLIITPLNFILYNTDVQKLANHGLHPWWFHCCLNFPLLFGFFALFAAYGVVKFTVLRVLPFGGGRPNVINTLAVLSLVVPLALLSAIPHQEPRFLLPLLIPVLIITRFQCGEWYHRYTWYLFNAGAVLVFSFVHQAGVVPSLLYFGNNCAQTSTDVYYWHTYIPPTHLAGVPCPNFHVKHLLDAVPADAWKSIDESLAKQQAVYVVVPSTAHMQLKALNKAYDVQLIKSLFPHITTELPPMVTTPHIEFHGSVLEVFEQWRKVLDTLPGVVEQLGPIYKNELFLNVYRVKKGKSGGKNGGKKQ